jgi:hypothetical protein
MWELAIVILVILVLLYIGKPVEKFISYTATYSEYGQQPIAILTKYIEQKMNYYELDKRTKKLMIMEIFTNAKYKLYSDDSLVREGILDKEYQDTINYLLANAPRYANAKFCVAGEETTKYNLWLNGISIDLGVFGPSCSPNDLYNAKKIFNLMEVSDISSYTAQPV